MKKIPFYSFWFAKTSIDLADVVYIMVITTFIYQKTASALIASLFPLFKALTRLIAGLTSPVLYEKFRFSKLLLNLQGLKALILTVLLIFFEQVSSNIYLLLAVILVIAFLEGWGNPLLQSVIPKIVPKEELVKANSSLSIASQSVQMVGFLLTGFAVIKWGHHSILAVTDTLLWLSVIGLWLTINSLSNLSENKVHGQSKWALMKEGWGLIWYNQTLRMVTLMDVIEGMAGSIWIGAITLVYVKVALNQGEEWWGFINASYFIGTIIGGICTLFLSKMIQRHLIASMAIGSFLFSIFTFIYGLTSIPIVALLLCVAMGPAYQIRDIAQQTAFQLNIPSELLSKVYASQSTLLSVVTSVSILLMGFIADYVGVRAVYLLGAFLIFLSAVISFTLVHATKQKKDEFYLS